MKKLSIIDFTSMIFSACYNCSNNPLITDNFLEYKKTLDYYMDNILKITNAEYFICCIDKGKSFRHSLFPTYKSNRNYTYLKFFNDLYEYAYKKYNCVSIERLEADDLVSIYARMFQYNYTNYDVTICHIDKDLMQIPGNHFWYNYFNKGISIDNAFEYVDYNNANKYLFKQLLIGDNTDNIKGLVSCGFATSEAYITDKSILNDTLNAFIYGIGKEEFSIKRNIKGNGKLIGVKLFYETYLQIKLLENFIEAEHFTFNEIEEKYKEEQIINHINILKDGNKPNNIIYDVSNF